MIKCYIRYLRDVLVKEFFGSVFGDRLEGIKVNGVVGNDIYIWFRL